MNSKISLIIRIIFGLFLLFFGANKIFGFMDPPPPPSPEAIAYWTALGAVHTMTLVAIIEIVAGLSLLFKKYVGLTMLVLLSVSVNAVLYHLAFEPETIMMAGVLLLLNLVVMYAHKNEYKGLLN